MKTQSLDTSPEIERIQIEGYRRMSAAQKIQIIFEMTGFVDAMAMMDIRNRYPEAPESEWRLRLASRWLEPALMLKAFGWDVKEKGY